MRWKYIAISRYDIQRNEAVNEPLLHVRGIPGVLESTGKAVAVAPSKEVTATLFPFHSDATQRDIISKLRDVLFPSVPFLGEGQCRLYTVNGLPLLLV